MRLQTMSDFDRAKTSGLISLFHRGRSAQLYLAATEQNTPPIIYKEFCDRGFWDKIKSVVAGSRARRASRCHSLLSSFGFKTPRVFDVIEASQVPQRSILPMEYQNDAVSLRKFMSTAEIKQRREVLRLLAKEVACMHAVGIAHDDMNLGNVLLRREVKGRLSLIWIDIERIRRSLVGRYSLRSAQVSKNLRQLGKIDVGLLRSEKRYFFRCYKNQLGATKREVRVALEAIVKTGVY